MTRRHSSPSCRSSIRTITYATMIPAAPTRPVLEALIAAGNGRLRGIRYGVLCNAMKRIASGCSPAEKAALFHDTAARVYRLAV